MAVSALSKSSFGTFDRFQKTSAGNSASAGVFVMAGAYVNSSGYSTSPDGITWTLRSANGMGSTQGLIRWNNGFANLGASRGGCFLSDATAPTSVALGDYSTSSSYGSNSSFQLANGVPCYGYDRGFTANGYTVAGFASPGVQGIAYGNGVWIYNYNGTTYRAANPTQFPTNITFSTVTNNTSSATAAAYGNGVFVVAGSGNLSSSPDGITWTSRISQNFYNVYFVGSLFIAANTTNIYTSPDGINWTSRPSAALAGNVIQGAAYGNGMYVAMTNNGLLWSSPDGATWTSRTNPQAGNNWYTIKANYLAFG